MSILKTKIVNIGNSRGVRLPKLLIEQAGFDQEVEISVEKQGILLRPVAHPRAGWDAQFKKMAERKDDGLVDLPSLTEFDEKEWEW